MHLSKTTENVTCCQLQIYCTWSLLSNAGISRQLHVLLWNVLPANGTFNIFLQLDKEKAFQGIAKWFQEEKIWNKHSLEILQIACHGSWCLVCGAVCRWSLLGPAPCWIIQDGRPLKVIGVSVSRGGNNRRCVASNCQFSCTPPPESTSPLC